MRPAFKPRLRGEKLMRLLQAPGVVGPFAGLDVPWLLAMRAEVRRDNVAASEIEQVIAVVPGVRETAVVGKPHPMLDEVPVAFIIPQGGVGKANEEVYLNVMAACRSALADFKVPREIRFVDEMPRSTLEKVAKAELRKMLTP
jgi:crotonobetaine/carnitine-CoA ligase